MVATAVYVINRLPSSILSEKSPFKLLFGSVRTMLISSHLVVEFFPFLRDYAEQILAPGSRPYIFLGYSSLHKDFVDLIRTLLSFF